jgi:hypothetical protein
VFERQRNLRSPTLRRLVLVVTFGIGSLFLSGVDFADEGLLPSGHGFMLIRIKLSSRERVDQIAMSNLDTNEIVRINTGSFRQAGLNAWIALASMPKGRYFLSEYQPKYGTTASEVQNLPLMYRRGTPGSRNDTFEIVPGVVNYVGDWALRLETSRALLKSAVEFDKSTLERYVTEYPEHSGQYNIYLSPLGEKAISLNELAKAAE